jgi:hypothetical protein
MRIRGLRAVRFSSKTKLLVLVAGLALSGCETSPWWVGLNGANLPSDYLYRDNKSLAYRAVQLSELEEACYGVAAGEDPTTAAAEAEANNWASGVSAASIRPAASGVNVIGANGTRTITQIQLAARACRDRVVGANLDFINEMWSRFQRDYFARTGSTAVTFESAVTGLGAFAAISPAGTAHVLAATAATLNAMGTSIQKNLEGGQLAYILLAQMDADREQVGAKIRQNLLLDYDKYPLSVAMYDVASYGGTLSVPSALANISAASGSKKALAVQNAYGASAASAASAASGASAPAPASG